MTPAAPISVVLTFFQKVKKGKDGAAEIMFERVTKIRNIGGMVPPEINSILKIFKKLRSSFIVAIVRPLDGQ